MRISVSCLSALGVCASVAFFAACSNGGSQIAPRVGAAATLQGVETATRAAHTQSWMLPEARNRQSLLYVSNQGSGSVTVYTYVDGGGLVLVGTLTRFSKPAGMCTDSAGDVWIPDYDTRKIAEYPRGGTKPVLTIDQRIGHPFDCAVDPRTDNLAVADQHPNGHFQSYSDVVVYPKGSRQGKAYYTADGFSPVFFVAYDNMSDLFVDGTPCIQPSGCPPGGFSGGPPGLFELSKGASAFTQLTLSGATLNSPSAINWIKPTMLLGDQNFEGHGTNGAYKVLVSGSTATVVGTLQFEGTQQAYGFWRRAGRVVVPDYSGNIVRIYNLSNGSLISTLTTGISEPFGAVVSP